MDEMHGHIYITGYKTSEEYKALYVYYSSMYEDPIAENFDNSLREMTTDYEPAVEEPAVAISDSDNLSDGSAVTVPAVSDKPKQKDKSSAGQDGKKKSSAKSKAAEKHEKIKQKIDGKYSGKNSKNSKKK